MGLFDALWRNDARFLKRKKSDAGETGRALEEIRGSLYNDFQTPEGAKRHQQRFCGPVVAMSFNFMVAVGIITTNKLVMKKAGFHFPAFLTLIHYLVAWVLLAIFKALALLPLSPPSKTTPFSSLFCLGAVMSFASGLSNASLKHNSIGIYQMGKIAVTPAIVLAEFILFKKTISYKKVLALAVVSAGVAIATVTNLEYSFAGACLAVAWIFPSATNKILWSNLQQQANWTALALMWKTTPVTILFLLASMPWLDPPGVLSFKWDLNNSIMVLISALFGFLLQWSGALALGATSATAHVILGQFKSCFLLLVDYLLFGSEPGIMSICGALTAISGMTAYTSLNLQNSNENLSSQPQKQNLSSTKAKTQAEPTTRDSTDFDTIGSTNAV